MAQHLDIAISLATGAGERITVERAGDHSTGFTGDALYGLRIGDAVEE